MNRDTGSTGSLEISAERYKFLVEESGTIISTHRPEDWAYTAVNSAVVEVVGYEPKELMGAPAYFFFHPEDAEAMKQKTIPAIYAHGTRTFRYRTLHKKGHYLWLESTQRSIRDPDSGELLEIISVSRDITAQYQAEVAAKRLATVAESSGDLVLFCDHHLQVTYCNASARRMFGVKGEEALSALLSARSYQQVLDEVMAVVQVEDEWVGRLAIESDCFGKAFMELQQVQIHGETQWGDSNDYYSLVIRDLTRQREAEQAERDRHQEMAHAARLMTMGEMATGLAHEINQPLATILNYSRGGIRRINSGRLTSVLEIKPMLESITRQAQRSADIIKRLRMLVKKTSYQRLRFSLNDLCRDVVGFLNHDIVAAEITVEYELQGSLPLLEADAVQIEQVLINVLRNAIEAISVSKNGSRVITLATTSEATDLFLRVTNYSGGISEQEKEKIFEPYFTTKHSGLGMGLSITRSIIEAHSGSICMLTDGQRYTTVEVKLPVAHS